MNAQLQRIENETSIARNDEFSIEYTFCRKLLSKRIEHFGEVAVQHFFFAALDEDLIAVAKDENTEAIPLWLVEPFSTRRHLVDALSEHGQNGRVDSKVHARGVAIAIWVQMAGVRSGGVPWS